MAKNKRSLFDWLTGSSNDDYHVSFDSLDNESYLQEPAPAKTFTPPVAPSGTAPATGKRGSIANVQPAAHAHAQHAPAPFAEPEPLEGALAVDMYQTPTHIIIKAMVAGVRPEDLDISITRDAVTLRGKREGHTEGGSNNFHFKELYWGAFSRSLTLPQEIDIEGAEASEKHGLLIIRLPKTDRSKQTKVKVKAS